MNIKTILFDLDGTLINTNELIIQSFMHTFKQYGMEFTRDEIVKFNGPPLTETFEKVDSNKVTEMIATYREFNYLHHDDYVTAFPHVMETVRQLREQDIKLGIVTTKLRKGVNMGLEITGLDQLIKTVVTLDDVTHAKPHPEPVLMAMDELGGDPESTLMIGDNYHDIEAGHHAGVLTAGVAWAQRGKDFLLQYNPTFMLEDMRDLLELVRVKA